MTTRTIERPKVEKLTEPAKGWRNKWKVVKPFTFQSTGAPARLGQIYWGRFRYPTRDVAETSAARDLAWEAKNYGDHVAEYLGAFPVEAS